MYAWNKRQFGILLPVFAAGTPGADTMIVSTALFHVRWQMSCKIMYLPLAIVYSIAEYRVIVSQRNQMFHIHDSFPMAEHVQERFQVRGMHCENCVATVERALARVDGVKQVHAKLDAQGTVTITYDPSKASPELLRQAVERVGYEMVST